MHLSCRGGGLFVVLLLCLTGCTVVTGRPIAENEIPAGLDRYYLQTLHWESCRGYPADAESRLAIGNDPGMRCARLTVPLDYAHPDGRTASIAVLRIRASDRAHRIGSLIVNPGGPGESGLPAAAGLLDGTFGTALHERFDLVGFDPRGVGASRPAVRCRTDAEQDAIRDETPLADEQAEADRDQAENQAYAKECARRSGTDVLATVGTVDVARDLDVLRFVLGDRGLTYLGYSYGTLIGALYAERFPRYVRAMVLDGAVDPDQNDDDGGMDLEQAIDLDDSPDRFDQFDSFDDWCVTQPHCAAGATTDDFEPTMAALTDPLKAHPLPVGDRKLSYSDVQVAMVQAMYSKKEWGKLNTALAELANGQGGELLQLADDYLGRGKDGHYSNQNDVFNAVTCADYPHPKDRQTQDDGFRPPQNVCAFWPVPNSNSPHVPRVSGAAAPLVISTTHDPATPYRNGVSLADELHGRLLTFQGYQHTVFLDGDKCVDRAGINYLVGRTLPPVGTTCS